INRDPGEIRWSTHLEFDGTHPKAVVDEASRWVEAGFSELVLYCGGPDPAATAERAANAVLPHLVHLGQARVSP
ncbi:MAG: hypothetical protein M3072_14155, partial [Candidatus Dormibacteraeota bacterium]|nr:hypothetical protein [Candidatus Dormibacteraeota bacterium]